jgi:acetyl-CoA carboxylase biotin carboxylase subunit
VNSISTGNFCSSYSDADKDLMHLRFVDEAVCIGPGASSDSYLNIPAII